jgi:2-hydroxycyclohexanecarboxyl-CoA dehydrogenase
MDLGLAGKVVLVTGGGQGIGQAIALAFAAEGAVVAVNDLTSERTGDTLAAIARGGGRGLDAAADITSFDAVTRMAAGIVAAAGRIDVLVNNAALLTPKLFVESDPQDWEREIGVILFGTLNCTRAVIDGMIARKSGKIVNIASDAARVGQERDTYYSAAKAGVIAFAKSLAKEVGPSNINVNAVSPGATDTPMRQTAQQQALRTLGAEKFAEREKKILRAYPIRRIAEPADIANTVVFLASEAARHITGQVVSVNGGFCMPG